MIPKDKQLHLLAGFAAGIFPAVLAGAPAGSLVALVAGIAKEYDDGHGRNRGTVDKMDVWYTVAGGVLSDLVALLGVGLTLLI